MVVVGLTPSRSEHKCVLARLENRRAVQRAANRQPHQPQRSRDSQDECAFALSGALTQTRYCQLVALPEGTNAEPVCEALKASITTLPVQLRRSMTWDQGKEMAEHRRFSVETGVEVCFCDPRSPWQRGSNENTNGLLRQYFPKGKSLAGVTQAELDEVARKLNGRPRQTLGFRTPVEKLTELIDGLLTGAPER